MMIAAAEVVNMCRVLTAWGGGTTPLYYLIFRQLKYNSHVTKYIHLKYIIQWALVHLQSCATVI